MSEATTIGEIEDFTKIKVETGPKEEENKEPEKEDVNIEPQEEKSKEVEQPQTPPPGKPKSQLRIEGLIKEVKTLRSQVNNLNENINKKDLAQQNLDKENRISVLRAERTQARRDGRDDDFDKLDDQLMQEMVSAHSTQTTNEIRNADQYFKTTLGYSWYGEDDDKTWAAEGLSRKITNNPDSPEFAHLKTDAQKLKFVGEQIEKKFEVNPYENSQISSGVTQIGPSNESSEITKSDLTDIERFFPLDSKKKLKARLAGLNKISEISDVLEG